MDQLKRLTQWIGKYRLGLLVLLVGVILMLLPSGEDSSERVDNTVETEQLELSVQLEQLLAQINGVGKAQVLLTLEAGEYTHYRIDENGTVIVTDSDRAQQGLVEQVSAVTYRGAVVVCQGADSPTVRLNIVEAVAGLTGLSTDKITVVKMK